MKRLDQQDADHDHEEVDKVDDLVVRSGRCPREAGTEKATRRMHSVTRGELTALQPTHWLAEVGAVLARESAETAAVLSQR